VIRARQDALDRWQDLHRRQMEQWHKAATERDQAEEANIEQQIDASTQELSMLDQILADDFPDYQALVNPQPLSLSELRDLLEGDEALVSWLVTEKAAHVIVVRRDRARALRLSVGAAEIAALVRHLRQGLDPELAFINQRLEPFDAVAAHRLYRAVFAPVEKWLEGVRHLLLVPDGALQSLPLGVLVTKESQSEFTDFSGYRQTQWLARKYAMTTLPSVSSLKALRTFAKQSKASRPFFGVGDPHLEGATGSGRGVKLAALFKARGIADVDSVRQLPSLPETAGELRSLAETLGAGEEALLLGSEATETRVKQAGLADYKVIAFATHGLVAGDLTGLSEPALVLTPPATGTEQDDGLLTASEVALLKLDADWVILSACNTAAADGTPGADSLSGLAKAFFYAGSRTLLVSHWPVVSDAAVQITTRMLKEAAKPGVGRAEAHRRAMLTLIEDKDRPHFAHPLFWAPFVVVGEGGLAGSTRSP
jgi:CHAT domain-containing protein